MPSPKLCIITTNKARYSETFIQNHIKHLTFREKVLYKGMSTIIYDWDTEQPLVNPNFYKVKKILKRNVGTFSDDQYVTNYLSQYLAKNKIQVVLAEFGPVGDHVAEACAKAGIPLVIHFHGDDAHADVFIHKYQGYKRAIAHAKAVVCVSEPMKQNLIQLGFPKHKLHLIPYGIDSDFFTKGKPEDSATNFLATGRFVEKKAPHLLILAFQRVVQQVPKAKLYMIGTGPLLIACKELVKALHLEENIVFKGVCPQEEVQKNLKNSRAFLMHSVTPETGEKEGTPLSILEASATGIPVISTVHAGIPQAVLHEKTGYLVEEYDINKMAAYIIQLAQDAPLAARMGEAGRDHILANYNLTDQIGKLALVIEEAAHS